MAEAVDQLSVGAVAQLGEWMAELADLSNAAELLEWDQQTMMPARGAGGRAEALATLRRVSHSRFVSAETGRLLEAAEAALDGASGDSGGASADSRRVAVDSGGAGADSGRTAADSDDARLVRVTRRRWEKARRVPTELAAEQARAASLGQEAWVQARAESDFASFAPYLEHNLELARRYVDCFDEFDSPYDVLLDDYEPGFKAAEVARLFAELKSELVPLIATLASRSDRVDAGWLHDRVAVEDQRALVADVVGKMGFDPSAWRLDTAVHPFATSFGSHDVRITTRWDETYFPMALFGAMHECGHGLYEAGIADSLQRTPLGHGESLGLHESQSRMWENMVGRGRPFSEVLAPLIAERFGGASADRSGGPSGSGGPSTSGGRSASGGPFAALKPDTLFRAVNRVQPSFIRVEADEATYGLHIVLRFELEQELIEGRLGVSELPEAWNARFKAYLGLDVPDDAHGVLQDVHWSMGAIGYFPTYALGNLIAGQLWERAHRDVPDLDDQLRAGELQGLREWLREHVHRHGAKFSMPELLERVVGSEIAVGPFMAYLKRKLGEVYGVAL